MMFDQNIDYHVQTIIYSYMSKQYITNTLSQLSDAINKCRVKINNLKK